MQWDQELNDEQRAACAASLQHHCLLAGPGTGKTRVLTHRVAHLQQVHGVDLGRVLVLTFTRAAAAEVRGRLRRDFGEVFTLVRVSTIHAFALRQLVRNDAAPTAPDRVVIADDSDEGDVIFPDLRRRLGYHDVRQVREGINEIAAGWAQLTADDPNWEAGHRLAPLLGALREHRQAYGYVLRAELVYKFYRALLTRPDFDLESFDHVLVDEYQDLTESELRVVQQMAGRGAVIYAAGDDDQAIYGWRKSTPDGIRRFETDYGVGSFLRLVDCQRCDRGIVDLAQLVIAQDPDRIAKDLRAAHDEPGVVDCRGYRGDKSEAAAVAAIAATRIAGGVKPEQVLVLVRGKGEVKRIAEALVAAGQPVSQETDPYAELKTADGRKVLVFLRLVVDDDENLAWRQFMRASGFGENVVIEYHDAAVSRGLPFADLLGAVHRDPGAQVGLSRVDAAAKFVAATLAKISRFTDAPPEDLTAQIELIVGLALDESAPALVALLAQAANEVAAEGGVPATWRDAALALAGRRGGVDESRSATAGVRVMTMHAAKGLDGDSVIIAGADHDVMHHGAAGAQWYEEVRLMYVSLTRAMHYLGITFPGRRTGDQVYRHGGGGPQHLSETLSEFVNPTMHR